VPAQLMPALRSSPNSALREDQSEGHRVTPQMSEEITPEGTADNSNDAAMTEKLRLNAVRRYDVLDTPPDGAFDRVTTIAAQVLKVPIAIISIVDHDRIWFKSHHGLDVEQIDRDPGLCASCILQGGPWIVNDAKADPRALQILWLQASSVSSSTSAYRCARGTGSTSALSA
jgi:hypothetical protein